MENRNSQTSKSQKLEDIYSIRGQQLTVMFGLVLPRQQLWMLEKRKRLGIISGQTRSRSTNLSESRVQYRLVFRDALFFIMSIFKGHRDDQPANYGLVKISLTIVLAVARLGGGGTPDRLRCDLNGRLTNFSGRRVDGRRRNGRFKKDLCVSLVNIRAS
ncbi:hypothetical protein E2C01_027751 [Portunus trituberculatus]|uniref:Uncharacterized protein n=1 Tax=Portunus trituberculatus TaxID=210409 RepID=A0A5B7EMD9_PORTR|nr:hypothetical protein [Portunus trituberculatus]